MICYRMSDWGTPPGMIDNDVRAESPANDVREAQLAKRRQLLKEKERRKRQQQLGAIGRNEVSSGRRREGKTPLVTEITDPNENSCRYAYDGPEAYNDESSYPRASSGLSNTRIHMVNVAASTEVHSDADSMEDISAVADTYSSPSSVPSAPLQQPQKLKKKNKEEKETRQRETKREKPKIEDTLSSDDDDLETAVIPDSSPPVCCVQHFR